MESSSEEEEAAGDTNTGDKQIHGCHDNTYGAKWAIKTGGISSQTSHNKSQSSSSLQETALCLVNSNSLAPPIDNGDENIPSTSTSCLSLEQQVCHGRYNSEEAIAISNPTNLNTDENKTPTVDGNDECEEPQTDVMDQNVPFSIFTIATRKRKATEVEPTDPQPPKELSIRLALVLLLLIFAACLGALAFVYSSFPKMEESEARHVLKFPTNIDDAKQLGKVLLRYKDRYWLEVMGGIAVTYLFLQTFAIPGSIFLSIVSGYLFSFPVALAIICCCSATGASFCYLLSYLAGRPLVNRYLPQRAANWSSKVHSHRKSLCSYIIFLRITPFLPNWFINVVSPVIGVPLTPFYFGTLIGVAPPSFVCIQAGTTLQQLTASTDALTFESVALLVVFAILSLLPVIYRNRLSIKAFLQKNNERLTNCCHKDSNVDNASNITLPQAQESKICSCFNKTSEEENMCQNENNLSQSSP